LTSRGSSGVAVVVEDEWLVRMEIADALSAAGWEVLETTTGEAALELLRSGRPVELLVTDIRLPGPVNGWDVAEKYREAHKEVMVIYCSGNPVDENRRVTESLFLPKPCRIDLLLGNLPRPMSA
jgi:CheY-like chemotaxis protein